MENDSHRIDNLTFVFSLLVIVLAAAWLVYNGTFDEGLLPGQNLSWYLIRSSGIAAYILITLSVIWGLALSSSVVKDWSPGPLTMLLHSTLSWAGLVIGMAHGLMLLLDSYFTYRITDIVVPFVGPYRPFATGLGTLGLWITLLVTPSFALKKHLFSYRAWRTLHFLSYAAFLLVTAHGLMAGTDAPNLGFRLLFGLSVLLTVILLGYRIGVRQASAPKPQRARPAAARAEADAAAEGDRRRTVPQAGD